MFQIEEDNQINSNTNQNNDMKYYIFCNILILCLSVVNAIKCSVSLAAKGPWIDHILYVYDTHHEL